MTRISVLSFIRISWKKNRFILSSHWIKYFYILKRVNFGAIFMRTFATIKMLFQNWKSSQVHQKIEEKDG